MHIKPFTRRAGARLPVLPAANDDLAATRAARIGAALRQHQGNDAVHIFHPDILAARAEAFVAGFAGRAVYAVKANPHPAVIRGLWAAGITGFDVASIREVELVRELCPDAALYFMHPVKSRQAIARAAALGVSCWSYDHADELAKILDEAGNARAQTLILRLAVGGEGAAYALKGKFGASIEDAPLLLRRAAASGARIGISFHVGSQCLRPAAWAEAIATAQAVTRLAGVTLDVIDVGGGFPVAYPGMTPPPLAEILDVIHNAIAASDFAQAELLAEPGRALVAEAGAVAARVELRKSGDLYLNDGTYGALFDAGTPAWPFAVWAVPADGRSLQADQQDWRCFGPTCDSLDVLSRPVPLPGDIAEGDWIVFDHLGAYGHAMQTRFNGFYSEDWLEIPVSLPAGAAKHRANRIRARKRRR